jgi:hypothetical protein
LEAAPDDVRNADEHLLPKVVADDHDAHARPAGWRFFGCEHASQQRRHANGREALMRHDFNGGIDRNPVCLHAGRTAAVRARTLERSVLEQVGQRRQRRCALTPRVDRPHTDEAARVFDWRWPQHERVERAEHRCAHTDAKRERQHRAERERG